MTNLLGSSRTVVFVLRTKVFAKTILKHYLRTKMFMKTVRVLRTGLMQVGHLEKTVLCVCVCVCVCVSVCVCLCVLVH